MEAMGGSPTPQELDAVMYELDSNGDSVVDFPEFLTKFLTATDEKELLSVFHQLAIQEGEGNDDRVLTLTAVERSFQYVGERLTDEDKKYLEIIFRGADKDGNGRLDIKEFTAYLEKMDDELFMGQAGALSNLLAAANISGGTKGFRNGRYGGGSAGPGTSQRRSNGDDGAGDGGDGAAGSGTGGAGTDAEVTAPMLTNSQILAMATRALSGRVGAGGSLGFGSGGLQDDVESITSNQRNSFLSRLKRRHRRSSVNSSTIAAIAGQLASMGVASSGRPVRVGSMNSVPCLAAAGLLQPEASEGPRSVSSARMAMHPNQGTYHGPTPGPGGTPHFLVEGSNASALRLVSSTSQIGGFLSPEDHSPRTVPATAPVALSCGVSFGDSVAAANGIGPDGAAAAVAGLPHQHQHQHHPGRALALAAVAGGTPSGTTGGSNIEGHGHNGHSSHHHHSPAYQHPYPHLHNQQQLPPPFHQMRSQSMSATMSVSSAQLLTPLAIPASVRDSDEPISGTASPFSPASFTSGTMPQGQERPGGTHVGYASWAAGGMRSPAASWQKASVIQEAPEEGDSAYSGAGTMGVAQPVVMATQQRMEHRVELPVRTSAPTRFARLASFPARLPPQPEMEGASGGGDGDAVAAGEIYDCVKGNGGPFPPQPIRLMSGGDGRFGHRLGGLVAAVFSRQRSLGPSAAAAAAQAAASAQNPINAVPEPSIRPSPSQPPPSPELQLSGGPNDGEGGRRTGSSGSWGLAAGARAAMGWLRRASSLGNSHTVVGSSVSANGAETVGSDDRVSHNRSRTRVWSPQPAEAAVAAAGCIPAAATGTGSLAAPWRLTVEVPGSDSSFSPKLTSPADLEATSSHGGGEDASTLTPPFSPSPSSPFTSPAGAAAASAPIANGGGGGLASPPAAILAGSAAHATAVVTAAALTTAEPGPPSLFGSSSQPPSPAPCPRAYPVSVISPGRLAHTATMQSYFRPPGAPHNRASAPGGPLSPSPSSSSSTGLQQSPRLYQQPVQRTSLGLDTMELVMATPTRTQRSPSQVPGSMSPRVSGSALGVGASRSLHRSGSVGGSSRLAVSSARDSPPMVPPHVQRQQSLQHHHHHAPLASPTPPHRLSQQGLPQCLPYTPNAPPRMPQSPHDSGQPHRLSHTGLPHDALQYQIPQPLPEQQQPAPGASIPMHRQSSLPRGDDGFNSPAGPQYQQVVQLQPGTESGSSLAGGSLSAQAQVSQRAQSSTSPTSVGNATSAAAAATATATAAVATTMAAVAAATAAAPGSPWAAVWASARSLQRGAPSGGSGSGDGAGIGDDIEVGAADCDPGGRGRPRALHG
ncbi:hypothetical protein Vretimale_1057 [Volvox reticuliferus]|nr:hypothetical protein Vretifemale_10374 [Volvox reticuliferus]GIL94950.1 hypothetical protein Vretimale_1057 [Volvox reticuliferus]